MESKGSFQTAARPESSTKPKTNAQVASALSEAMVAASSTDTAAKKIEEQDLSPQERVVLAKLDLGTDYTANVTIGSFIFKINYPSVAEDELIMVEEERQYDGVKNPSEDLRLTALVWATLGVVVKEVWKTDGAKPNKICGLGEFAFFFKNMKNSRKIYRDIILPLYTKYLEFEQKLNEEVDPLKNI